MKTKSLALTALFVALIVLLGMTPLGLIPLGFINVTILCLPVLVGTLTLGLPRGLVLGVSFGTVSLLNMLRGGSTLAGNLFNAAPVLAVLICYLPRLAFPAVAAFVYRLMGRKKTAMVVSAFAGSITNTILYLGLMWVFYAVSGQDLAPINKLILGTGVIAGPSEAVVAAILVPPIVLAVQKVYKKEGADA